MHGPQALSRLVSLDNCFLICGQAGHFMPGVATAPLCIMGLAADGGVQGVGIKGMLVTPALGRALRQCKDLGALARYTEVVGQAVEGVVEGCDAVLGRGQGSVHVGTCERGGEAAKQNAVPCTDVGGQQVGDGRGSGSAGMGVVGMRAVESDGGGSDWESSASEPTSGAVSDERSHGGFTYRQVYYTYNKANQRDGKTLDVMHKGECLC